MTEAAPSPLPPIACSVEDAARRIGISKAMVYKLVRTGKLDAVKVGARTLIRIADLDKLVA